MNPFENAEMKTRYILSAFGMEKEVSKEEFIKAERSAGFRPKYGDGLATGGFSGGGISGRIENEWHLNGYKVAWNHEELTWAVFDSNGNTIKSAPKSEKNPIRYGINYIMEKL